MSPDPAGRRARHRCLPPCTGAGGTGSHQGGGRGGRGVWDADKSILGFCVGPLGGVASAFYPVGKTLSLLQEMNSQKHKARGAGLFEVSESGLCLLGVPGKRETRLQGTESPKQASSLRVCPEGFLGHIPSQTLTKVPIPTLP